MLHQRLSVRHTVRNALSRVVLVCQGVLRILQNCAPGIGNCGLRFQPCVLTMYVCSQGTYCIQRCYRQHLQQQKAPWRILDEARPGGSLDRVSPSSVSSTGAGRASRRAACLLFAHPMHPSITADWPCVLAACPLYFQDYTYVVTNVCCRRSGCEMKVAQNLVELVPTVFGLIRLRILHMKKPGRRCLSPDYTSGFLKAFEIATVSAPLAC